VQTTKVVPADLNAFIYMLERNIAWMANQTGNSTLSDEFNKLAAARKEAIEQVLWNPSTSSWHDAILMAINNGGSSSTSRSRSSARSL